MTGYERIKNFLAREPIDRIPVHEHFWNDTLADYTAKGHIKEGESMYEHFNLDIVLAGDANLALDLDFVPEIIAEDEDTITTKNGNYATLRRHKKHDSTPEHVDFAIKTYEDWKRVKPMLTKFDERRFRTQWYRDERKKAKEQDRFFCWVGLHVFELISRVSGHEHMLAAMALEPGMIADMCETYSALIVQYQKILFEREGLPDGIWFYEDLGFKERPFMSPAMYRELIRPAHKYTIDFAHQNNLPVVMHSCGFVEPLLDDMVEAGIDCLQAIEVKSGMDPIRIYEKYGDRLSLIGGIDVRALYSNDKAVIDAELEKKIPILKGKYGYCLHSDHSIPKTVDYETLRYFIQRGIELGTY